MNDVPKITVSMSQKVNLGNYESADCSICLSSIPFDASEQLIEEMLDTTDKIVIPAMRKKLREKIANIRQESRSAA